MIERLGIQFHREFSEVVDLSRGDEFPRWLVDARLNVVESCFNAPSDATAIVFQSEGSAFSTMTYGELNALTNRVANGLTNAGFQQGDPIAVNMSMHPESVAVYLGIIKAGCVVIAIADSFAPDEVQMRLRIANAKGIFTQDYIRRAGRQLPLYARVVDANAPQAIVLSRGDENLRLNCGTVIWVGRGFSAITINLTQLAVIPTATRISCFPRERRENPKRFRGRKRRQSNALRMPIYITTSSPGMCWRGPPTLAG